MVDRLGYPRLATFRESAPLGEHQNLWSAPHFIPAEDALHDEDTAVDRHLFLSVMSFSNRMDLLMVLSFLCIMACSGSVFKQYTLCTFVEIALEADDWLDVACNDLCMALSAP